MSKLNYISQKLSEEFKGTITCKEYNGGILLNGELDKWEDIVKAGKLAAKYNKTYKMKYKGIVNDITLKNYNSKPIKIPSIIDSLYDGKNPDVLIIGGGIIGCSIARALSKWAIDVMVVDKEYDVAVMASSRNDGMIHPGIDIHPGTKKSYYNPRGNEMYTQITKELDVEFERRGGYILFDKNWHKLIVPILLLRAKRNHIPGVRYVSKKEVLEKEKSVANWVKGGIFMPNSGVLSPYKMTIAFAENAATNGVNFCFNTAVTAIEKEKNRIVKVITNRGVISPKIVINAAGVYSDIVAEMAGDRFFSIHPRKGTVAILDIKSNSLTQSVIAKLPFSDVSKNTKGGGIVRTIDNNILVGPDAIETPDREDNSTNIESINQIFKKHSKVAPSLSKSDIITYFSGTRAATYEEDFIVEASENVANLVHAAGIQSPGVTSAPAIAEEIEDIVLEKLREQEMVVKNPNYNPIRKDIPHCAKMSDEERNELIKQNPDYGVIICRCEEVSKGEIIDAIKSPIPATTLDAIKRRVRPGMGRCQGGFCSPLIIRIISEELGIDIKEVTKDSIGSNLILGMTKERNERETKNNCKEGGEMYAEV